MRPVGTAAQPQRHHFGHAWNGLRRSVQGSVVVEFAFITPFLILLLLGASELARYITTLRKITIASSSIAQILSENQTGTVNFNDVLAALDSAMITFPGVLADSHSKGMNWWNDMQVSMASVAFNPTVPACQSNCTYTPSVAWAYGPNQRSCTTTLTSAPDTSPPSRSTLPQSSFGAGSLIVVDVVYTYVPAIGRGVFGTMTIKRSFYITPRFVPLIKYSDPPMAPSIGATVCPGYQ